MKKLLLGLMLINVSAVFSMGSGDPIYDKWVRYVQNAPKVELCHIQNYINGNKTKLDSYINSLATIKGMANKVTTLKELKSTLYMWKNSEDDIERLYLPTLNGVINKRLSDQQWGVCSK
jgi:esterase/lipase